jgi:hypothetical protein
LNCANAALTGAEGSPMSSTLAHEEHLTVADIGTRWNLSSDAVRRLFADEPV